MVLAGGIRNTPLRQPTYLRMILDIKIETRSSLSSKVGDIEKDRWEIQSFLFHSKLWIDKPKCQSYFPEKKAPFPKLPKNKGPAQDLSGETIIQITSIFFCSRFPSGKLNLYTSFAVVLISMAAITSKETSVSKMIHTKHDNYARYIFDIGEKGES